MSAPAPFTPKPSIIDRVLGRLFPTDQYGGLLKPTEQRALQRQGLLQLGTGLLADTGPGNALSALGRSYQGIDFGGMADHALKLQAYRAGLAQEQAIADAARAHQPGAGATREDRYNSFADWLAAVAMLPGGAPIAEKGAALLQAMKPDRAAAADRPMEVPGTDYRPGSPFFGQNGQWLIDPVTRKRLDFIPIKDKPTGAPKVTDQESRATAQALLAAHLDGTQLEQHDVIPSTAAAAIGGLVQKIAGQQAGHGVTALLRRSTTNSEQQAAGRWADAAIALMPHTRSSVQLREKLLQNYWPQEGDTPENVARKTAARKAATAALARAVATGVPTLLPEYEPEAIPSAVP